MSSRDFNMLVKRLREARADIVAANRDLRGAAVIDDVMPYLVAASRRDAQIATAQCEGAEQMRERCIAACEEAIRQQEIDFGLATTGGAEQALDLVRALPLENEPGDAS